MVATDSTQPTFSSNSTNSTGYQGQDVEHRLFISDNYGVSGYIFSFDNCTGSFVNDSWVGYSETNFEEQTGAEGDDDEVCDPYWVAMDFTADVSKVTKLSLYIVKTGTPPSDLVVEIRENDSGNPASTYLSQANFTAAEITSGAWNDFDLPDVQTVVGQSYWIVLHSDSCSSGNEFYWAFLNQAGTHVGKHSNNNGSTWYGGSDNLYKVYGTNETYWANVTKKNVCPSGGTVRWKVYANDTSDNWGESSTFSYLVDISPVLTSSSIFPSLAHSYEDLKANATCTDPDSSDTITAYVNWYKDGVFQLSASKVVSSGVNTVVSTLKSGNTSGSEKWKAEIWCGDGKYNSSKANSSAFILEVKSISLDVGDDGVKEYSNDSLVGEVEVDFTSNLTSLLSSCTADASGLCTIAVNLTFTNSTVGVDNIIINYSNVTEIENASAVINSYLSSCSADANGDCEVPFKFHSRESGLLEYSAINITYIPGDDPPSVTQESPADAASFGSGASVTLNCSATDDFNLVNISILTDFSGSWAYNQTENKSGTWNSSSLTFSPADGNYKWACEACDNASQCTLSSNRTLSVSPIKAGSVNCGGNYILKKDESLNIVCQVMNDSNTPVDYASCILDILAGNLNSFLVDNGAMEHIADSMGLYNYSYTFVSSGNFPFEVNCTSGGSSVFDSGTIQVLGWVNDIFDNQTVIWNRLNTIPAYVWNYSDRLIHGYE